VAVAWVGGSSYSANAATINGDNTAFDWSSAFTPTAGNCLVFFVSLGTTGNTDVTVSTSGWTLVHKVITGGSLAAVCYIKENCAATDTSLTVTGTSAVNGIFFVREYSGGKTSGIIDANGKAEEEANISTAAGTCATGTTGTRSQANGLGIAIVACDSGSNIANDAWSSGWGSTVLYANRTTSTGFRVAEKAISSTAGDSATLTLSTSDQSYGVILILDEASSGAPTLSDIRAINIGATSVQWSVDYTF